ncbi:MAG: hypothetical protein P8J33_09730 [Pirellulaceae bacterium]|nr:hypothetical protein [Pirellulaceae bacterium]
MKFKTIFLFGLVGLIVSAPFLIKPDNPENGLDGNQGIWGFSNPAPDANDGSNNSVFTGATGASTPYQFASSPNNYSPAVSVSGNNVATPPPSSAVSEPVYYAFLSMDEFLRFDVSPDWIKNRWPRVSTFPTENNLTGMRVPLVSGPRPQDIHGSLTYFIDSNQQVQRIGFRGRTGDASDLVNFAQQQGYKREKSNGAGLFTKKSWGRTKGALRLDHPPVTQKELPNEKLIVLFEITNPSGNLEISQNTQNILTAMEKMP